MVAILLSLTYPFDSNLRSWGILVCSVTFLMYDDEALKSDMFFFQTGIWITIFYSIALSTFVQVQYIFTASSAAIVGCHRNKGFPSSCPAFHSLCDRTLGFRARTMGISTIPVVLGCGDGTSCWDNDPGSEEGFLRPCSAPQLNLKRASSYQSSSKWKEMAPPDRQTYWWAGTAEEAGQTASKRNNKYRTNY